MEVGTKGTGNSKCFCEFDSWEEIGIKRRNYSPLGTSCNAVRCKNLDGNSSEVYFCTVVHSARSLEYFIVYAYLSCQKMSGSACSALLTNWTQNGSVSNYERSP